MKNTLGRLRIKIFADGANVEIMKRAYREGFVKGFTTNPTLMKKAGVTDYKAFAREALSEIKKLPISFEVFSDDFAGMETEALEIASWAPNVYVKIPITDTSGEPAIALIKKLSAKGLQLNITAITTLEQVRAAADALSADSRSVVSVFAGRVADTGRDPVPHMAEALRMIAKKPNIELLWASPRELLNIFQADACGCHIITVSDDILKKNPMAGMDLGELSLETVKMFHRDAVSSGFKIV
ncbi:MAG: transaldolase [Elusimicrobia bacterium GWC2_51_8]|nr:MAG: transaldolase [Elusimicrobia bacterium GWA2_51_34]OGR65260.1 MAG: transaldolase [Elusimicrobia bacterium GWC2_51_8]OGR88343.1 MAG: transaldolase [Elusimicrobia bacterium GWF2_52_66]HAF94628.1 transaldolase [Elusimicrobiota bacterium]HCE98038.1 transaldolase [Elusimicrobiota bacterium]